MADNINTRAIVYDMLFVYQGLKEYCMLRLSRAYACPRWDCGLHQGGTMYKVFYRLL